MIDTKIYRDIAARTDGAFMLGVVGPVRTGKSTFIKRFMETMVIPEIENTYTRERARDELPQSGSGRTIMTAEPKFIPEEAVRLSFLLATPVILAAGVLKVPDLTGPLGAGIHGQILAGSLAAFVCAYVAARFLTRWFETRTLTPFAVYCLIAGPVAFLLVR